ncbi:hypothetical protein VTO42DRAFT_6018 [Malbranchea cinnamomea]
MGLSNSQAPKRWQQMSVLAWSTNSTASLTISAMKDLIAYSRHLLARYTYEYSRSELSQDTFLRAFAECMGLVISTEQDPDLDGEENQLQNFPASAPHSHHPPTFQQSNEPKEKHMSIFQHQTECQFSKASALSVTTIIA